MPIRIKCLKHYKESVNNVDNKEHHNIKHCKNSIGFKMKYAIQHTAPIHTHFSINILGRFVSLSTKQAYDLFALR